MMSNTYLETRISSSSLKHDKSSGDGRNTEGSGVENGGGLSESFERSTLSTLHNHEYNGEIALLACGAEETV